MHLPAAERHRLATAQIRHLLHRDPYWSVYALGDLDPRRARYCEWFVLGSSIALLYREFEIPILFAAGSPDILDEVPDVGPCLAQVPDAFRTAFTQRFTADGLRPFLRMALAPGALTPPRTAVPTEPLDLRHETEIRDLYADGDERHEAPDFFMRDQLSDGTFVGVRVDGRLVAAGGTHLYSASERTAAIGNVYTHRGYRGRGFGAAVTSRVAAKLIARGTETIALNVKADNARAVRIYEHLGFHIHCAFLEGPTTRRASP